MHKPRSYFLWIWVLLAASFCWAGEPASSGSTKKTTNDNQQRRQAARARVAKAAEERVKTDPNFTAYVESVGKRLDATQQWTKGKGKNNAQRQ